MHILYTLTVTISLLTLGTVAKSDTPLASELSDGIYAFICERFYNDKNVPLILIRKKDNWNLSGIPELSVNKIDKGFTFKSTGKLEGFGFLKKGNDSSWKIEFLNETGSYKSKCDPQDVFVNLLIKSITPKIIENVNSLAKKTYDAKRDLLSVESRKRVLKARLEDDLDNPKAEYKNSKMHLTGEEADNFISKIQQCWNVPEGAKNNSSYVIAMGIKLTQDSILEEEPKKLSLNTGSEAGMLQAYEAARRALIRCQPFKLPAEKHEAWREMEIKFDHLDISLMLP
tara:strand:+ start:116703 stop:117557 length:855 start_codon:yes stop_codon:yes gene_type:complete